MPKLLFTPHLQKHLHCPELQVPGTTVREALEAVFADNPRLSSYLLDDQGCLRQHVMIFVDQQVIHDRKFLSDPLRESSEVYVMQALSGG